MREHLRSFWAALLRGMLLFLCVRSADAMAFEFADCNDSASAPQLHGSLCASVPVPLRSQQKVSGGAPETLYLFVRKFPAAKAPAGTVWLIAGGPGESGATFYPFITTFRRAFPSFDILIPDHRGTGYSTRLCPTEEAIGSLGGGALVGAERSSCWQTLRSQPEYAKSFSISNAARDLIFMLESDHSTRPTYLYGTSYGTQLILRAQLIEPLAVEGIVFDSLIPPESSPQWDLGHRDAIVNAAGMAFLERCATVANCRGPITGSLTQAYAELLERMPQPLLEQIPGHDLRVFFGGLLDFPRLRPRIPRLIDELAHGRTVELTATKQALNAEVAALQQYPQSSLSLPLIAIISASENFAPPQAPPQSSTPKRLMFATSSPELLSSPQLPVYSRDRYFGAVPRSLPPTLVIQGTLDSKTPFVAAQTHVRQLRIAGTIDLVPALDSTHLVFMSAPQCVIAAVARFRTGAQPGIPAECAKSALLLH